MNLQFLTTEQFDSTIKLADILSIEDLTSAAAILASFDWNLQKTIAEMQIGPIQPTSTQPTPPKNEPENKINSELVDDNPYTYEGQDQYEYDDNNNQYEYSGQFLDQKKKMFEEQYASLLPLHKTLSQPNKQLNALQNHKLLAKDYKAHRQQYFRNLISKSEYICNKILSSKSQGRNSYKDSQLKIQNNRKFINYLYTNYHPRINFTFGTFFLNLTRSYLEGKFLLVYIHNITLQNQNRFNKLIQLIFRQKQIARFVNQHCISYGLFDNSDDYQNIQKYVAIKDLPAFALFRLNKNKRSEQFISAYKINGQAEIFLEWLATNIGITLKKKQAALNQKQQRIKEQIHQEQLQQKQLQQKQQAQLIQKQQYYDHRYIKEQQDQLYAELEKTYLNKKKLSLDRKQHIQTEEEQLQARRLEAEKDKQPQSLQNAIQIRFRMPISGQSVSRRFYLDDPVSKLFTYVDCFCRDEFEQKFNDFDLRQTFPPLNLREFQHKTLKQVFEGSRRENVIVRQL